jgi:hypothetical protein
MVDANRRRNLQIPSELRDRMHTLAVVVELASELDSTATKLRRVKRQALRTPS